MAYQKVCDAHGPPMAGEVLHCAEVLELDWDLDKEELPDPGSGMDHPPLQHMDCPRSGNISQLNPAPVTENPGTGGGCTCAWRV